MATREELAANVRYGARTLDQWDIDWWEVIDIDHLRMESGFSCVLGQLEESMTEDYRRPRSLANAIGRSIGYPRDMGFATDDDGDDYDILRELWIEEIL